MLTDERPVLTVGSTRATGIKQNMQHTCSAHSQHIQDSKHDTNYLELDGIFRFFSVVTLVSCSFAAHPLSDDVIRLRIT